MGSTLGAFAPFALLDHRHAIAVPAALGWTDAAALPVGLSTEHDALVTQGGFSAGNSVLIVGATSSVGLVGIQLAKALGAGLVIGTTTSDEKASRLTDAGADLVVNTKTESLVEKVTEATGGAGVDIVLDHVGGQVFADLLPATRIGGMIINIGRLAGPESTINLDQLSFRRLRVRGTTFSVRTPEERAEVYAALVPDVLPAVAEGGSARSSTGSSPSTTHLKLPTTCARTRPSERSSSSCLGSRADGRSCLPGRHERRRDRRRQRHRPRGRGALRPRRRPCGHRRHRRSARRGGRRVAGAGALGFNWTSPTERHSPGSSTRPRRGTAPLDVMVNNAGIDWIGPFHEEPDEVSRREIEVNLFGAITGSRLAVQRMLPRGRGHLVNVASGVGRVPLPGSAVYSATKHGVVGLTESLRLEYRGSGLRFSVIQPAQVETAMLDGQARPPLLARVTADDVAAAVVDAVRKNRFEVWVPRNQAVTAKIGNILPRRAREASCA